MCTRIILHLHVLVQVGVRVVRVHVKGEGGMWQGGGGFWEFRGGMLLLDDHSIPRSRSGRHLLEPAPLERGGTNARDGVRDHHRRDSVALLCVHTKERRVSPGRRTGQTVNLFEATRTTKHRVQSPRGSSAQCGQTGEALCSVLC